MLGAVLVTGAALAVAGVIVWQAIVSGGLPDPTALETSASAKVVDIAVLVFREGLESILVLAAVTAGMVGSKTRYRRPVTVGVGAGIMATLLTWVVAVRVLDSLLTNVSALHLQAITGLVAIVVLLVVMNWFFHSVYWSGWISMHTTRKRRLLTAAGDPETSRARLLWGMGLLGFSSFYREGFEVVLFLQHYRLRLGGVPVLYGVLLGTGLTAVVAVLTFLAHRKLPYKKMLIATGLLLGVVLLVMVGEQAQEMQLAHWLSTTPIPALERVLPGWMGLWFGVSPNVETVTAQAVAGALVLLSYAAVELRLLRTRRSERSK
ncbi:MAG: iron permease [Gemmatimonadetes bacterium SCN 70-22]|nr:MAG: iron permease [Gemmatimonadetes bacterium SCN 70-22]